MSFPIRTLERSARFMSALNFSPKERNRTPAGEAEGLDGRIGALLPSCPPNSQTVSRAVSSSADPESSRPSYPIRARSPGTVPFSSAHSYSPSARRRAACPFRDGTRAPLHRRLMPEGSLPNALARSAAVTSTVSMASFSLSANISRPPFLLHPSCGTNLS